MFSILSYDLARFEYGAYSVFLVKVRYVSSRILLKVKIDKADQDKTYEAASRFSCSLAELELLRPSESGHRTVLGHFATFSALASS